MQRPSSQREILRRRYNSRTIWLVWVRVFQTALLWLSILLIPLVHVITRPDWQSVIYLWGADAMLLLTAQLLRIRIRHSLELIQNALNLLDSNYYTHHV